MLKEKIIYLPLGTLLVATVVSGMLLTSNEISAVSDTAGATVTVSSACTFDGDTSASYAVSVENGTYEDNIGSTTIKTVCNDENGYAIYAIGYSNNELGNTNLVSASGNILTGDAVSGDTSAWAMKVSSVSGTYAPTITNDFDDYRAVPSSYTQVASFAGSTDTVDGSSVQTSYAIYVSSAQAAGTYTGQVRYTLVHPSSAAAPTE